MKFLLSVIVCPSHLSQPGQLAPYACRAALANVRRSVFIHELNGIGSTGAGSAPTAEHMTQLTH